MTDITTWPGPVYFDDDQWVEKARFSSVKGTIVVQHNLEISRFRMVRVEAVVTVLKNFAQSVDADVALTTAVVTLSNDAKQT